MATGQNNSKGNGASKRMANPKRKASRERCWARGQKRKEQRIAAAAERAQLNAELRAAGDLTPWELARLKRTEKRAGLDLHNAWHRKVNLPVPSSGCTVCTTETNGVAA